MNKFQLPAALLILCSAPGFGGSDLTLVSDIDTDALKSPPALIWGADPFLRKPGFVVADPRSEPMQPDNMKLTAVIYDRKDPMATISGQSVEIGDFLGTYEVKEIGIHFVVLEGAGARFELTMPPPPPASAKHSEIKALDPEESI